MTNNLDFDRVLSVCTDRLHAGDTMEACLTDYPSYASRLAPLLSIAAKMKVTVAPIMSVDGLRAGEARVLARAAEIKSGQRPASSARQRAVPDLMGNLRRLIAATLAVALLSCVVLSAGTVSAASTSLPGGALYAVKRVSESVVSSVAFTPQLQTRVHLNWADRRLREIEALVGRDGVADEELLMDLEQETQQALAAAEQAGSASLTSAVVHTERQHAVLTGLLETAPQAARHGLERALAASAQSQAKARSALEKADRSPGPAITPPGRAGNGPPVVPPGQVGTKPAGKKTPTAEVVDDTRGSESVGPPDHPGPPDQAGSPNSPSAPDHTGPPDHAVLPDDAGPPDHAGPPGDLGPPDHAGPPDDTGPPDDKGGGRGSEKGGGKDK